MTKDTEFDKLADEQAWLNASKLVVKPDMLFGKRGKSGLARVCPIPLSLSSFFEITFCIFEQTETFLLGEHQLILWMHCSIPD